MGLFLWAISWLPPKQNRRIRRLQRRMLWVPLTRFHFRQSMRMMVRVNRDKNFTYLRAICGLVALFLRWPWHYPCSLPPPPSVIMAYPDDEYFSQHYASLRNLRLLPLWQSRDTPQRSFFRLYEAMCADDQDYIGYETEYFWGRDDPAWKPCKILDPRLFGRLADGEDGVRQLAVLASLAEALADAFNWRMMWGMKRNGNHDNVLDRGAPVYAAIEGPPSWTQSVPKLLHKFELNPRPERARYDRDEDFIDENTGEVDPFRKRNIVADFGSLRTV